MQGRGRPGRVWQVVAPQSGAEKLQPWLLSCHSYVAKVTSGQSSVRQAGTAPVLLLALPFSTGLSHSGLLFPRSLHLLSFGPCMALAPCSSSSGAPVAALPVSGPSGRVCQCLPEL